MLEIRALTPEDWPGVWAVMAPIFREGASYPVAVDISEAGAKAYWSEPGKVTYVAIKEGRIVGTYYIRPNQESLGAHICNGGYLVAEDARGQGIASAMCGHSQDEARAMGYRGMQYNLVVASNIPAVNLWKKQGFHIAGTLPGAFRHKTLGYVDAYVMFKSLLD